jgi:hypothetical protein
MSSMAKSRCLLTRQRHPRQSTCMLSLGGQVRLSRALRGLCWEGENGKPADGGGFWACYTFRGRPLDDSAFASGSSGEMVMPWFFYAARPLSLIGELASALRRCLLSQRPIRLCAAAIASSREPMACETEGSALSGYAISNVHSFRPRPARISKLMSSWVMA